MAQRRAESIQEVPLAVSAFTGTFVRDTHLDDIKDLVKFTPGITGDSKDSFIDTLSIRGIITNDFGVGGDPSVGIFKNNIYQGRNGEVVTTLYDVERAELLRGPQGFLFGRNSIGGAISVFTKRPEFTGNDGYVSLDLGERGHGILEGGINLPVSENFAFRVAGFHSQEDGYVNNPFKPTQNNLIAHDNSGGRISTRYQQDTIDVNFMVEYEHREQSGSMYRATEKGETWDTWARARAGHRHAERQPQHQQQHGARRRRQLEHLELRPADGLGPRLRNADVADRLQRSRIRVRGRLRRDVGRRERLRAEPEGKVLRTGVASRFARQRRAVVVRRCFVLPGRDRRAVHATRRRRRDVSVLLLRPDVRAGVPRFHLLSDRPARGESRQGRIRRLGRVRRSELRVQRSVRCEPRRALHATTRSNSS